MKTYIIDRKTWLRGEGSLNSFLFKTNNEMCCLGQIARQFGYFQKEIRGIYSPREMKKKLLPNKNKFYEKFATNNANNTLIVYEMMEINDNNNICDALREKGLMKLAAKLDIKLEFIN